MKQKNGVNNEIKKDESDIDIDINIGDKIKMKNKEEEIFEIGNANNTVDKVNLLLKQLEAKTEEKNINGNIINKEEIDEENNEDEDIEKYLESLENK